MSFSAGMYYTHCKNNVRRVVTIINFFVANLDVVRSLLKNKIMSFSTRFIGGTVSTYRHQASGNLCLQPPNQWTNTAIQSDIPYCIPHRIVSGGHKLQIIRQNAINLQSPSPKLE